MSLNPFKFTFFILTLFVNISAFGQNNTNTIKGKAVDKKNNQAIDFATVALFSKESEKALISTQTDINGEFSFYNLKNGSYTISISFIGYETFNKTFEINTGQTEFNLGVLKLEQSTASVLDEVVVVGQKDIMQLGIDRKVFNAEQSIVTQGGTATDLLATIPSVQVDLDGNISLRGANNVKVLIDGKPSTFGGGDISAILQSLPASSIDKVELITNPSSKYDPEGQSGIINIILKKNQNNGLNGNLTLSAGRYENYNASGGINSRSEKWNFSSNYSYREGDRLGSGYNSTTFLGNTILPYTTSYQNSVRFNRNHTVKAGIEHYLSENTSLGLTGNLNLRNENNRENINQFFYNSQHNMTDSGPGFNMDTEDNIGYDVNLDFLHKFNKKGEELSANFSFGKRSEEEYENIVQQFFDINNNISVNRLGIDRINDVTQKNRNINLQLDYIKPLNEKSKVEAGYRSTFRYSNDDQISDTLILNSGIYGRDHALSNIFELEEIVHAIYGNYQNQITDKFGIQFGLRTEQAYLNTDISGLDANNVMQRSIGRLDYLRVYPSIYFTQKLLKDQQLQLSYSRRVNRPRGWQVNPFPNVSDRYNIRIGNPNLRPEDIHSYEFSYAKFWRLVTLTSSVYFRQVNDVVQGIRQENPDQNGGTIMRFYNIAKNQSVGLELISRVNITNTWNVTGNLNFFQTYFKGDEGLGINDNDGFNWFGMLNTNINLTKKLAAQGNMFYMAPRTMSQGKTKNMIGVDAGLKYDILNKKASLGFNVQDIFDSRRFGMQTMNQTFIQDFERRRMGRLYNFSISYRFGKTEFSNQKRNQNRTNENVPSGDEELGF